MLALLMLRILIVYALELRCWLLRRPGHHAPRRPSLRVLRACCSHRVCCRRHLHMTAPPWRRLLPELLDAFPVPLLVIVIMLELQSWLRLPLAPLRRRRRPGPRPTVSVQPGAPWRRPYLSPGGAAAGLRTGSCLCRRPHRKLQVLQPLLPEPLLPGPLLPEPLGARPRSECLLRHPRLRLLPRQTRSRSRTLPRRAAALPCGSGGRAKLRNVLPLWNLLAPPTWTTSACRRWSALLLPLPSRRWPSWILMFGTKQIASTGSAWLRTVMRD